MVRPFAPKDLDSIAKIWLETNIAAHSFIDENYWKNNYTIVKELLSNAEIFVYEENGDIKGFVGIMGEYIAGVFVEAGFQSKGVGKALLNHIKTKHLSLKLQVYKKNIKAINFYIREGFTVINQQIDKDTGQAEHVMNWQKGI